VSKLLSPKNSSVPPSLRPKRLTPVPVEQEPDSLAEPPVTPPPTPFTLSTTLPEWRGRGFRRGSLISANFAAALEALWVNRLRSLLTALGVFIGVAAVIGVLLLTEGVSASINDRILSLGTNVIIIVPGAARQGGVFQSAGSTQSLTTGDADAIAHIPHIVAVSPIISSSEQVIYGHQNWNTRVQGVSAAFQNIQNWQMAEGTWFSASDDRAGRPVALLGQTVMHNLFDASGADPIGQTIRIRNQLYLVIGVLQTKGQGGASNTDDVVYIPFTTALLRLKNTTYVDQIQVQVDSTDTIPQAQQDITALLERRHHIVSGNPDDFQMISSTQLLQTAQQFTQILTALLVGIAAISLTVGGIGIMNIMIVSVTERTREIGIRMSIGARRSDIRNQFLIEALVLCLLGGGIGMLLGFLLGLALTRAFQIPFVLTATSIVMPFIISASIGVIFGLYPAVRASRLDPIEALRSE
jgi:putative ABC transport system permease protein